MILRNLAIPSLLPIIVANPPPATPNTITRIDEAIQKENIKRLILGMVGKVSMKTKAASKGPQGLKPVSTPRYSGDLVLATCRQSNLPKPEYGLMAPTEDRPLRTRIIPLTSVATAPNIGLMVTIFPNARNSDISPM